MPKPAKNDDAKEIGPKITKKLVYFNIKLQKKRKNNRFR